VWCITSNPHRVAVLSCKNNLRVLFIGLESFPVARVRSLEIVMPCHFISPVFLSY
jgi:hypothetical protein